MGPPCHNPLYHFENMDSVLGFLSRLRGQAAKKNELDDTSVEGHNPEIFLKTDMQRDVLTEQPLPTGLEDNSIQTVIQGHKDNVDHKEPVVFVKQKLSIEK